MAEGSETEEQSARREATVQLCNITASYLPDDKMLTSTKAQESTSPPPDTGNIERAVSRQQTQVINGEKQEVEIHTWNSPNDPDNSYASSLIALDKFHVINLSG